MDRIGVKVGAVLRRFEEGAEQRTGSRKPVASRSHYVR